MNPTFTRTIRTASSERYLVALDGTDVAELDLHYLPDQSVHATLICLDGGPISDDDVPVLLQIVDECLLPSVSLDDRNLEFVVVMGRVLGAYKAGGA